MQPVLKVSELFSNSDYLAFHISLNIVPFVAYSRNRCVSLTTMNFGSGFSNLSSLCK